MIPGEYKLKSESISCNEGKTSTLITVLNTGDRPIQVGSHFHFYEVNKALKFERSKAFGKHLNIPSGTAVRFEPGDEKEVDVVSFSGEQHVYGLSNMTNGPIHKEES